MCVNGYGTDRDSAVMYVYACVRCAFARVLNSFSPSPVCVSLSLSLSRCVCVCMCVCDGVYVEVCIILSRTPDKFMP
jgi:hypothetical protein